MYQGRSEEADYTKTCIDLSFADNNLGMWIDDFYFSVECDSDMFGEAKSSAATLAAGAISATTMLAMTLF